MASTSRLEHDTSAENGGGMLPEPANGSTTNGETVASLEQLIETRLIETAAAMINTHRLSELGDVDKELRSTALRIRNRLMRVLPTDEAKLEAMKQADSDWVRLTGSDEKPITGEGEQSSPLSILKGSIELRETNVETTGE